MVRFRAARTSRREPDDWGRVYSKQIRRSSPMAKVPAFCSVDQVKRPQAHRVYHDNDRCFPGRDISLYDRCAGDKGYRLCVECTRLGAVALAATAELS